MAELKLTKNLVGLRDALIVLAKQQLEEVGDFDPRALAKTADGTVTLVESLGHLGDEIPKGLRAKQLGRYVEDVIRKMRDWQGSAISSASFCSPSVMLIRPKARSTLKIRPN